MRIEVAYTQHVGKNLRHRGQQDALWHGRQVLQANNVASAGYTADKAVITVAVADGVSISPSPEQASRRVLDWLAGEIAFGATFDIGTVRRIHGQLCDALGKGKTRGAATTLAAAQFTAQSCAVLNVGDSRVYRITAGGDWQQLSRDHTLLNVMIERGEARAEQQYASIYDCLDSCLVADDEETDFAVHRFEVPAQVGDQFLLCTDGVYGSLSAGELERLTEPSASTVVQVKQWRKAVLAAGAPDNLSMVLVRIIDNGTQRANA